MPIRELKRWARQHGLRQEEEDWFEGRESYIAFVRQKAVGPTNPPQRNEKQGQSPRTKAELTPLADMSIDQVGSQLHARSPRRLRVMVGESPAPSTPPHPVTPTGVEAGDAELDMPELQPSPRAGRRQSGASSPQVGFEWLADVVASFCVECGVNSPGRLSGDTRDFSILGGIEAD